MSKAEEYLDPIVTDKFFIDCLKEFLQIKKDELNYLEKNSSAYSNTSKDSIFGELKEDLESVISSLTEILSSIKTIDDLSLSDGETINSVFEYLEEFADNFVISNDEIQRKKDYDKYHQIEELLFLFYDEDEDSDDFDDDYEDDAEDFE
ncbi:MAG: hypothetical protein K5640_06150 [Treponema sp.]|nr:hypothetical protein [Treponema sp.]